MESCCLMPLSLKFHFEIKCIYGLFSHKLRCRSHNISVKNSKFGRKKNQFVKILDFAGLNPFMHENSDFCQNHHVGVIWATHKGSDNYFEIKIILL